MAAFFRHRITQKVISLLQNRQAVKAPINADIISSLIRINKYDRPIPEFSVPWSTIETVCKEAEISITPNELVKLLRNQGLPTAEGFTDIYLHEKGTLLVFAVDKHIFTKMVFDNITTNKGNLSKGDCMNIGGRKNIVIQCSVPVIGERCHITHFRSAIRSQFLTNLYRCFGHNVKQVIHVNDWGPDAATFLTGYKHFKTEEGQFAETSALNLFEVMKLARFRSQNDMEFSKKVQDTYERMKKGDSELLSDLEDIKRSCMSYYNKVYKRIGVKFDAMHFDSSSFKEFEKLSIELLDKNLVTEKDNYISLNCPVKYPKEYSSWNYFTGCNASMYSLSRCLYAIIEMKKTYAFHKMVYVGPETELEFYFALVYLLKELGYPWADYE